jgi:hypothetical protein
MDTYIAITWMAKKENLLFYKSLATINVDQCTSCPAEHENSSMKWGEMVFIAPNTVHNVLNVWIMKTRVVCIHYLICSIYSGV